MRRLVPLGLWLATGLGLPAAELPPPTIPLGEALEVRELTSGVWVATSYLPWPANCLVARFDDGTVLLVDTPPTTAFTRRLLDWIGHDLRPARVVAVNTHHHVDATGGNELLRDRGWPVWGSTHTRDLVVEKGDGMLARLRETALGTEHEGLFDGERPVPPSNPFEAAAGHTLRFGAQTAEIRFFGAAHARDNVVVWLPELGVLYGGCAIKAGSGLGYLGDADLESWPRVLDRLEGLGARWIVPGHGLRFDPGLLAHTRALLEAHPPID